MTRPPLEMWGMKELRALGPLWAACAIAVAAHDRLPGDFLPMLAVLAYLFGSVALGAQAIGHEYSHRTLGLLLSQPADRRLLFLVKLTVLALLLVGLALVASQTLFDARPLAADYADDLHERGIAPWRAALLIAVGSAFLAPALTMLTRSTLAGIVFTIAVPGMLATGAMVVGAARFGLRADAEIGRFTDAIFWPAMFGICAVAAVASWWLFGRLEAIDGGGRQIELGRWVRGGADAARQPRRRGVLTELALKELHLYQMPVVFAVIYAAAVPVIYFYAHPNPVLRGEILAPLTILYVFGVASLVGSLASAEERQLGTLEWQTLLPMSAWRQWTIKVGVAATVALILALGVPAALSLVAPPIGRLFAEADGVVATATVLFAVSLYVSSLCTGGVRALVVSLMTFLGMASLANWMLEWVARLMYGHGYRSYFSLYRGNPHYRRIAPWLFLAFGVLLLGGAFAVLGYWNHRSAERPWSRTAAQGVLLALVLAVVLTIGFLLGV